MPNKAIKDINWKFVYSEGHSLLMNDAFMLGFAGNLKIPGILKTIIYINKKGFQKCHTSKDELERVYKQGKIFFKESSRHKFQKEIAQQHKSFDNFWKEYKRMNMGSLSNKELLDVFKRYVKNLMLMVGYYQVSGGRTFPIVEEYVKEKMSEYFNKNELENRYSIVLTATDIDLLERENIDLLKLKEKNNINTKTLRNHAKNYAYLYLSTYDENKIFASLRERIHELWKEAQSSKSYETKLKQKKKVLFNKQKKIMGKLKNEPELVDIIEFLRFQGIARWDYKEFFMGAEYKFLELFEEIAKRINIPMFEYLHSYRIKDTHNFLQKGIKVLKPERQKRLKIFIAFKDKGKECFYSGKQAEEFEKKVFNIKKPLSKEVKGIIANPGKAVGKAHIILPKSFAHIQEALKDFKKGEVLITSMTQPSLVTIMKKAVAIVTNSGGITSHAAVLSREIGIPCIVSTFTATEVFKTGDLIEVDANKGIVKIIKKIK